MDIEDNNHNNNKYHIDPLGLDLGFDHYVYFLYSSDRTIYKVGVSKRVEKRVYDIMRASGDPTLHLIDLYGPFYKQLAYDMERAFLDLLGKSYRSFEWFEWKQGLEHFCEEIPSLMNELLCDIVSEGLFYFRR